MCNKMIYPTIRGKMAEFSGKPPDFDPSPEKTLGSIFQGSPDGYKAFHAILVDLDIATDEDPVGPDTTIAELKKLIMESSDRHLSTAYQTTPEKIAAARAKYAELARQAHAA